MTNPDTITVSSPLAIRALTNPVRLMAFDHLYATQKPLTASELARIAEVRPASMTYHLRVLKRYGLVKQAVRSTPGDRRERPWRAAAKNAVIMASEHANDFDQFVLLDSRINPQRARMHDVLRAHSSHWIRSRGYMVLSNGDLVLSDAERRAARDELEGIIRRYAKLSEGRVPGGPYTRSAYLWSLLPVEPAQQIARPNATDAARANASPARG